MTDANLRVVLGSCERRGAWTVPSHIDARVVLGHMQLDLRDAELGADTTIDVRVTFGNFEVLVPDDVAVEVDIESLAANVGDRGDAYAFVAAPARRLRVTGSVRFASCEVISVSRRHRLAPGLLPQGLLQGLPR